MSFKRLFWFMPAVALLLVGSATAHAKTLERAQDALKRRFPGSTIERDHTLLSTAERQSVAERLGQDAPIEQAMVSFYRVTRPDTTLIRAYLDAHRVRTLPETLLISIDPTGKVCGVDVLVFREPEEYMPGRAWYNQFMQKPFGPRLQLNRDIQGITGATLTGRATVNAVRKVLCIHTTIESRETAPTTTP